jgi:hypothetical protein
MPTQKILLFGFPHTGTTIFRNIMGHCEDVEEMICECRYAFQETTKPFVVVKYPFTWDQFFDDDYKDYIKIFIVRNPLWVFSSLNKRFSNNIPADHNMWSYFRVLDRFVYYASNPIPNSFLVRYEDLFDNNFAVMRNIFDTIGLKYGDEIFDNSKYVNKAQSSGNEIPKEEPEHTSHNAYRSYQVNQPFTNNNLLEKLDLNIHQRHAFCTNDLVKILYPNNEQIMKDYDAMVRERKQKEEKEIHQKQEEEKIEN